LKSDGQKRSNLQQPLSRLLKVKEINPILKALLKFCTTKTSLKILTSITSLIKVGVDYFQPLRQPN